MARHWTWTISAALALAAVTSATAQDAVQPPADPATETPPSAAEPADPAADPAATGPAAPAADDAAPGTSAAADLLCADIATLEDAHAAALVYYIAGYTDATAGMAGGTAAPMDNGMVGGLTLSAAAVIEACSTTPEQRIADVIAAQGGSMGERAPEAAPAEGATPADDALAPADDAMAPADDAAAPAEGEPPAEGAPATAPQ